jgi:hypothetical protein
LRRVNVLNAAATGVSQSDNVLEWSQSGYFIHAVIAEQFYEWNSGHWLVEDIMDVEASFALLAGVPTVIGLFVSLPFYPEDRAFNLAIHATLDLTVAFEGDLPCPPPDYWFQRCD